MLKVTEGVKKKMFLGVSGRLKTVKTPFIALVLGMQTSAVQ